MALVVAVVRDPKPFWLFCRSGYPGSNLFGYFVDRGVYHPAYFQFEINIRVPFVTLLQQSRIKSLGVTSGQQSIIIVNLCHKYNNISGLLKGVNFFLALVKRVCIHN